MKYVSLFLLLGGSVLPAQGVTETAQVAAVEADQAHTCIAAATAALQCLHENLCGLKTQADIKAALPGIEKAIRDYDTAMASVPAEWVPQESDLTDWRKAHRALRTLCTGDDFTELVWHNDALKYHLLLSSAHLPCYLHEETVEFMMMTSSGLGMESSADMKTHTDKIRAEAAPRHEEFMRSHAADYTGGNGADEASAIILRPLTETDKDPDADETEELRQRLIADYMHTVYPQFQCGYGFYEAVPDGAFYHIMAQYAGYYENEKGEPRLITFYVYFCTDLPDKRE